MADDLPGLEALCQAIRAGDDGAAARARQALAARNAPLLHMLDRLADAELAAGRHEAALHKLEILEAFQPQSGGTFLRRVSAAIATGVHGAMEELAAAAGRLAGDDELSHGVEMLLANGRPDLAAALIADAAAGGAFSPGIVAAAEARLLVSTGHLGAAVARLKTEMAAERPHLTAMRCHYLMLEDLPDFVAARGASRRAAVLWGEARDLVHVVTRLLQRFDFTGAQGALDEFAALHPAQADPVAALTAELAAARGPAEAALAEHGPAEGADPAAIFTALSAAETPASRVLWGKQALMALLDGPAMDAADYDRFAWFLPNWEDRRVRDQVLAAALRRFPQAPSVRRGRLHHLITRGAYADAALQCQDLLQDAVDPDTLFFAIGLLRLEQDRVVPSFMPPALFAALRMDVLARFAAAEPGFRSVMHDHLVALGGAPDDWPDAPGPEPMPLRRLFAVTTGRLGRISTAMPSPAAPAPPRPVLAISGQLRGFETAWESIHAHLARPVAAPVIVTVWDKSANALGRHAGRLERALPDDVVAQLPPEERFTDTFERAYPETFRLLFGQTDVDAHALRRLVDAAGATVLAVETESERPIERLLPPHVSANMLKMYYKFARVEALVQAEETRSGALFSHVIWSRPDCEILRLAPADLLSCLARTDVAWSSYTTENSFGDYAMVLPRRAFAAIAGIFPRVVTAGETTLLPWRPNRSPNPGQPSPLSAFGGPDVLFDVLLAAGYNPLARIPRMALRLLGRTPGADQVRRSFSAERAPAGTRAGA